MTVRLSLDPGVRRPRPDLLVGGVPVRVIRLSPDGARTLERLLAGEQGPDVARLEQRLRGAGMLLSAPGEPRTHEVTVVVPVRGSAAEVEAVLSGVPDGVPAVVVDDASAPPVALTARPGLTLVRHPRGTGPGAARSTGARQARTPLLAFVDAGVTLPPGALAHLSGHFADPHVVAVAPRVVSGPGRGLAGLLERELSALDLGAVPARVVRGSRVSYLPAAALLVRRSALEAVGGFDPALQVGEDVDLVWRLTDVGEVRYDPAVQVVHAPRAHLSAALRRRYVYGTAAGPLDARHPGRLRHHVLSRWTAAPWVAGAVHPALAAATLAVLTVRAPSALPSLPPATARRYALQGQLTAATAAGRYAVRPALPLTVLALVRSRRVRWLAPALALAYGAAVRADVTAGPARTWPARALLRVADDLCYTAGVWRGCASTGRPGPLLPGWGGQDQV